MDNNNGTSHLLKGEYILKLSMSFSYFFERSIQTAEMNGRGCSSPSLFPFDIRNAIPVGSPTG
jgi:hypothetical protein